MKIFYSRIFALYLFSLLIIVALGCKKSSTSSDTVSLPTVNTTAILINLTDTSAESGGVILSAGNGTITSNGVCYSTTNTTPTTSDSKTKDTINNSGTAITAFTSYLSGLSPNTKYYIRAYAINSAGVGYGGVTSFTTSSASTSIVATVSTFAGTGTAGYLDGAATGAQFNNPDGITIDDNGNLFVSDAYNDLIREISTSGTVSTVAGNQSIGYQNGIALSAQFYAPAGQVFDTQGNLYVADFGNNVIRKITPAGVVSTFAGTGIAGYLNGAKDSTNLKSSTDSLAMFNNPQGLAIDASGNIYVADRGNNVIREILTTGRTKTIAGNKVKGFIDATGEAAFFNNPTGIAIDKSGNIYVTDQGNSSLRKITTAGVVTTLVGNPVQTTLFNYPSALTIDPSGNLFIIDEGGRLYEFTTNSVLYILAGSLSSPGLVNGSGSVARFNYPQGITIDAKGNLYIADQYNNCIREVILTTSSGTYCCKKENDYEKIKKRLKCFKLV